MISLKFALKFILCNNDNKNIWLRAGEMALQLRTLATLPEDLSSFPCTNITHKHLQSVPRDPVPTFDLHRYCVHMVYRWYIYISRQTIRTHEIQKNEQKTQLRLGSLLYNILPPSFIPAQEYCNPPSWSLFSFLWIYLTFFFKLTFWYIGTWCFTWIEYP